MNRRFLLLTALGMALAGAAQADAVTALRQFTSEARSARASFTQTVVSPDGARKKVSSGVFQFSRPNRFRFEYQKPFEQLIVSDGQKVWLYDRDLNQVTVRALDQSLGGTPVALLSSAAPEKDFVLAALPDRDGLSWVQATPRVSGGTLQFLRVGFRGAALSAVELVDTFGQTTRLALAEVALNPALDDAGFRFTPPPGADVIGP